MPHGGHHNFKWKRNRCKCKHVHAAAAYVAAALSATVIMASAATKCNIKCWYSSSKISCSGYLAVILSRCDCRIGCSNSSVHQCANMIITAIMYALIDSRLEHHVDVIIGATIQQRKHECCRPFSVRAHRAARSAASQLVHVPRATFSKILVHHNAINVAIAPWTFLVPPLVAF